MSATPIHGSDAPNSGGASRQLPVNTNSRHPSVRFASDLSSIDSRSVSKDPIGSVSGPREAWDSVWMRRLSVSSNRRGSDTDFGLSDEQLKAIALKYCWSESRERAWTHGTEVSVGDSEFRLEAEREATVEAFASALERATAITQSQAVLDTQLDELARKCKRLASECVDVMQSNDAAAEIGDTALPDYNEKELGQILFCMASAPMYDMDPRSVSEHSGAAFDAAAPPGPNTHGGTQVSASTSPDRDIRLAEEEMRHATTSGNHDVDRRQHVLKLLQALRVPVIRPGAALDVAAPPNSNTHEGAQASVSPSIKRDLRVAEEEIRQATISGNNVDAPRGARELGDEVARRQEALNLLNGLITPVIQPDVALEVAAPPERDIRVAEEEKIRHVTTSGNHADAARCAHELGNEVARRNNLLGLLHGLKAPVIQPCAA